MNQRMLERLKTLLHINNEELTLMMLTPDLIDERISLEYSRPEWQYFEGWEKLADLEIFNKTVFMSSDIPNNSELFMLTESNVNIPYVAKIEELKEFYTNYYTLNKICFFNPDVILVSSEVNFIYIMQHDGFYINFYW